MTTKEMIEVMQAYERGEQIEYRMRTIPKNNEWDLITEEPDWNWADFDYRVKPQPKYRPYKNADEFLQAQKEHGKQIKSIAPDLYLEPVCISDQFVAVCMPNGNGGLKYETIYYEDLLKYYLCEDGTKCGIKQ